MSGRESPAPQRRELEIMRVLFDRQLKERAVVLADARWPGSGKMVDLAYEWGRLSPEQRREQLSAIGPEEIARFRTFAELNPGLAAAVDELDRRGALPHIENAVIDISAASRADSAPAPATEDAAPEPEPAQAASEPEPVETVESAPAESEMPRAEPDALDAPPVDYGFEDADINPLQVDMPELDLGLPSTSDFLDSEARRREESARETEASMERVRQRLEQSAQRAFERGSAFSIPKAPEIPRPTLPSISTATNAVAAATRARETDKSRAIEAPRTLASELETHVVASIRAGDPIPSDDELVALANDRQLGLSEHRITYENRKEEFGGLVKEFGRISTHPGRLARAVAEPNLVVVRGRTISQLAPRFREGFLDIPGTRATVRLHPSARVVLIGE